MIDNARQVVAVAVNTELSMLYWNIGRRINKEILHEKRAEYGKRWSEKLLRHCLRAAEIFQDEQIFSTLCRQFSWSHIRLFMYIDDSLKRDFYIEISRIEKWSVRTLQDRINSLLFERTAISRKPEETIAHDLKALRERGEVSADLVFRDPYFLDFLVLSDSYSERDVESALIVELQRFIIELGQDFAFLARQKRITIDNRDY